MYFLAKLGWKSLDSKHLKKTFTLYHLSSKIFQTWEKTHKLIADEARRPPKLVHPLLDQILHHWDWRRGAGLGRGSRRTCGQSAEFQGYSFFWCFLSFVFKNVNPCDWQFLVYHNNKWHGRLRSKNLTIFFEYTKCYSMHWCSLVTSNYLCPMSQHQKTKFSRF